jgi:hypothetical protein
MFTYRKEGKKLKKNVLYILRYMLIIYYYDK